MITVESLTKTYGGFTAVNDVSFTAATGRVTGFLGPNGAGKSTTLRILVGLTPATTGTATIDGAEAEFDGSGAGTLILRPGSPTPMRFRNRACSA